MKNCIRSFVIFMLMCGNAQLSFSQNTFEVKSLIHQNSIELIWKNSSDLNIFAFEIEKFIPLPSSLDNGNKGGWSKIGVVENKNSGKTNTNFSFFDPGTSGKNTYRVKQISRDGREQYSNTIEVIIGGSERHLLAQNYPNPFNPSTVISYYIPKDGKVTLKVFDIIGKEITTLVNADVNSGIHEVMFDGNALVSGVYFYTLRSGSFVETKRMLIVK